MTLDRPDVQKTSRKQSQRQERSPLPSVWLQLGTPRRCGQVRIAPVYSAAEYAKITTTAKNNSDHLLHHKVTAADAACPQRLVSRRPFSRHAVRLSYDNCYPALAWTDRVDSGPLLIQIACPQPIYI